MRELKNQPSLRRYQHLLIGILQSRLQLFPCVSKQNRSCRCVLQQRVDGTTSALSCSTPLKQTVAPQVQYTNLMASYNAWPILQGLHSILDIGSKNSRCCCSFNLAVPPRC